MAGAAEFAQAAVENLATGDQLNEHAQTLVTTVAEQCFEEVKKQAEKAAGKRVQGAFRRTRNH